MHPHDDSGDVDDSSLIRRLSTSGLLLNMAAPSRGNTGAHVKQTKY